MVNYSQVPAQDAVCQSHTGHMTGLWFLPALPLRLNINEWMNEWMNHCCRGKAISIYTFWVPVCSLRCRACSAHAPYCHLWPAPLYDIFPHYLIKVTILGKQLLNLTLNPLPWKIWWATNKASGWQMGFNSAFQGLVSVFWVSVQILSETFHILTRMKREIIINLCWSSCLVSFIFVIF